MDSRATRPRGMKKAPKGKKRSYGHANGRLGQRGNKEDLRPLAARRLTLREMRDAGIWKPVVDEKEKR